MATFTLGATVAVMGAMTAAPAGAVGPTALINADTVAGTCSSSFEATLAAGDGFTVTCVSGATWDAMTEAQFQAFTVLVIGDPDCSSIAGSAISNVNTWAKAVMDSGGNRFTIGSDPDFHAGGDPTNNRAHVVKDGIAFAGALAGKTGIYLDTSCEATANNVTLLNALSVSHTGWSVETPVCAGNIGIVASNPSMVDTKDADLSDWFCSSHADYPTWPGDWVPFAVSADAPTKGYCANDVETGLQVCGEPYILLAGGSVVVSSNITLTPATATNPVGTSHTVTATVTKDKVPQAGVTVTFVVSAGPNVGKTGTAVTNASGQATFTYTDTGGAGTDTIVASFIDDFGAKEQATASKTWEGGPPPDTTPPACALTKVITGPPKAIQITTQDTGSGLKSIAVTTSTNASVAVPAFATGTTSPVVVVATKLDQTKSSTVALTVTDVAGNVTKCDPTMVSVARGRGGRRTITGVPAGEHYLTVVNGSPGLRVVFALVNGHLFEVSGLAPGEQRTIDISSAMHAGNANVIRLGGLGVRGGSADILVSDGIGGG